MAMFQSAAVLMQVLLLLLTNSAILLPVSALPFIGMEDNCILSFVVPKEKMKSSCELDEKVNRRINAMETKVNIYKQQVSDLQTQLDKQRHLNSEKLAKLEQQVKDMSVNVDMSFLIERRLTLIEKEFEQLHTEVSSRVAPGKTKPGVRDQETLSLLFNTVDSNEVVLSNVAKSMIESEIQAMYDNLTNRVETYVQEQILLSNKVLHMIQKGTEVTERSAKETDSSEQSSSETMKVKTSHAKTTPEVDTVQAKTETTNPREKDIVDQFDKMAALVFDHDTSQVYGVNVTHDNVNDSLEHTNFTLETANMTDEYSNVTHELNNSVVEHIARTEERSGGNETVWSSSTVVAIGDLFGTNHSLVGETSDMNRTLNVHLATPVDNDISRGATSRIHSQSELASESTGHDNTETGHDKHDNTDSESDKHWSDGMVRDQQSEEKIKDEITALLLRPLAEVMSTIEKQKISLEEKIKLQDEKCEQMNKDVSTHVKELNGSFQAITLRIESLSRGFQDSFSKIDKIKSLETLLHEVKKNITSQPIITMSVTEVEEQSKKLKKLERLVGVYQQSLERYRNETKQEFREIRDSLEKDANAMKMLAKTLHSNITTTLSSEINRQNNTIMNRIQEITDQLRMQDESLILLQLDLGNVEKALNSKASRYSDRDVERMQEELNQLAVRQRDFRKKLEYLDQSQGSLADNFTTTVNEIASLKMDVKLSLDEWIPYKFEFDPSRTECYGDQYVKRTKYSKARFVGVVLCSSRRYKIFLSSSLHAKFLNIGDGSGMGEDHCEFVGAASNSPVTLSEHRQTFEIIQGYFRSHWGDKPFLAQLNGIRPSARWYECNVDIP